MAEENKEIRLKVGELTAREEAGRGIVRMDSSTMHKLEIKEGDVVEIEGSKKTAAIAVRAYPADVGLNIIRMDGIVRRNAGSGVGEYVKIRKAETKEARHVTIAPAEKGLILHVSPNLIKQNIYMRPVVKGDIFIPSPVVRKRARGGTFFDEIFGSDFFEEFFFTPFPGETRFVVTNTDPSGIVRISDMTELEILPELPETLRLEEKVIPAVTYEDVGGIKEIVHKVREMIELPLRHPEIFERLGIDAPRGVLLYGPPGTGKTLLAKAVANESGANFYSISGPEIFSMWYGKSLPYDEEIFVLENGMPKRKPIGEIVEKGNKKDLKVLSFDKNGKIRFAEITNLIKHENDSKILEIRTKSGRKIRVTDYHSLFTLKNNRIVPIKTSELVPRESYIAIPNFIPLPKNTVEEINLLEALTKKDFGLVVKNVQDYLKQARGKLGHDEVAKILGCKKKYLYDIINKNVGIKVTKFLELMKEAKMELNINEMRIYAKRTSSLPAKIKLTEDFSTFLGLWIAEGSYTKDLEVRLTVSEGEFENIQDLCERLFGKVSVYKDRRSKACDIIICSKVLGVLLKEILGLQDGSDKKRIPEIILASNKNNIAAFLRGYFSGDGSIYLNQRGVATVESGTKSKKLSDDLLYALLHFGIVAKKYDRDNQNFRICFTGVENLKRFQEIGFLDRLRNLRVVNYIYGVRGERSEQIPLTPEIRTFLSDARIEVPSRAVTIGKDRLNKIVENLPQNSWVEELEEITTNDIYWDRVEEIVEVPYEGKYVYDISVHRDENFVGGFGGIFAHNTEENLRKIFEEAEKNAPSIIFIDEIDAIAPKREEVHGEVEKRTVSQLLTLMDGLKKRGKVVVIAATNIPNSIDPALRRAGRFDREIEFPVPDRNGRLEIFKIHTRSMPLDKDVDLNWLADITYGYVGADIMALCKEAAMSSLRRVLPEIKWKEETELPKEIVGKLVVKKADFENALKVVEPSAMREVLVEIPKVKWSDVGDLEDVKQQLKEMIEWPLKSPESFEEMGIEPPKGILLYGPPGCGKTLLAKAVANESGANFISVKGPELFSKWFGETEQRIRELFRRARQVAPAIIFFDEIDALAPRRGLYRGSAATETVVSQLLNEMSGIEETKNIVIVAATNRPDIVDPALLRPGRIDRFVLIPPPNSKARLEILKIHTKNMPLKGVDLREVAEKTDGFSGADLEALCREAAMGALRENIKAKSVEKRHFDEALKKITPSLSKEVQTHYEKFVERQKKVRKPEEEKEQFGYIG